MSAETCPYELAVVEAARIGQWNERLRAHARECAECADSLRVAAWMGSIALRLGRDEPASDPAYIWLSAEIERRAAETARALRRELHVQALLSVPIALAAAAAALAIGPILSATVSSLRAWLPTALAEASRVDLTAIGSAWLGLPLFLAAVYLLVFRAAR